MTNPKLTINKYKYVIALCVFAIYLCISFYKISINSLWYDEGFSIDLANCSLEEITQYSLYYDTNPPLYLYILHYWMQLFGESELALRSLSALAMSLGCGVFFLLCNKFFNWQTAIFSTLLFFVSNDLFYYAQEGRTYGLVILFSILSTYSFLSLIKNPNWKNAILLGVFNSVVFYLHTLASFVFVAQIFLIPILAFQKFCFYKKNGVNSIVLGYSLKHFLFYLLSWVTFYFLFIPWQKRFIGILSAKGGSFWLAKPGVEDLYKCLFDIFNGQVPFYLFLAISTSILLFICLKKYLNSDFNHKLLITAMVIGPCIMFLSYYLAITVTPIFLKRYILFSTVGFILLFGYLLSILSFQFLYKFILFLCFSIFLLMNLKIPRESYWDYKEAMQLLKGKVNKETFFAIDEPLLFSYYGDIPDAFSSSWPVRDSILRSNNVFPVKEPLWVNSTDFSKYNNIYFVTSYVQNYDQNGLILETLNKKFKLDTFQSFKGVSIYHYKKFQIDTFQLNSIIQNIKNDVPWYNEVKKIATKKNRTLDSVLYEVALWQIKKGK